MALGFKKSSGPRLQDIGLLGGLGVAALGGPVAPLILAAMYSSQKDDQDQREKAAVAESARSRLMGGYDPLDASGGDINWNPMQPPSGTKQVMADTQGPTQTGENLPPRFTQMPVGGEELDAAKRAYLNSQRQDAMTAFPDLAAKQRISELFPERLSPKDRYMNVPDVGLVDIGGGAPSTVIGVPAKAQSMGGIKRFTDGRKTFDAYENAPGTQAAITAGKWRLADNQGIGMVDMLRPDEVKALGLDPSGAYQRDRKTGKIDVITQPKQQNPTEAQANAAYNAERIADALTQVGGIISKDPEAATSFMLEATEGVPGMGMIGRSMASDNQKIFRNNMADAVDAIITLGTGAAYTGEQKIAARNAYLPQIGDSQVVKDDKYRKLISTYNAAREKARMAGKQLPDPSVFKQLFSAPTNAPQSAIPKAPPLGTRVPGQQYDTPRGPMRWTGTGWVEP